MAAADLRNSPPATTHIHWWPKAPPLTPGGWCVAYAKSRQDKRLGQDISELGGAACALFQAHVRRYPGKGTQTSWLPLLGGYVFVRSPDHDHPAQSIYATGRCARVLPVIQQEDFLKDFKQLLTLAACASTPLIVRPELCPGAEVTIREGSFAGCSGRIVRRQGTTDLVVNLQVLGCSVATHMPSDWADLIESDLLLR